MDYHEWRQRIGGPMKPITYERRRTPLFRVASACFTLFIAAAFAQESAPTSPPVDANGWASLKWGMTLQQAREAMPELQLLASPTENQFMLTRLETKIAQIGPVRVDVSVQVQFYPGKDYLGAVDLGIFTDRTMGPDVGYHVDARQRATGFAGLKEGLTGKYGKPTNEDTSRKTDAFGGISVIETVLWRLKSSTIRLRSSGDSDIGYVEVRYAERKPDNTDRKSTRLNSSHLGISYA